jgi:hypothetical protein
MATANATGGRPEAVRGTNPIPFPDAPEEEEEDGDLRPPPSGAPLVLDPPAGGRPSAGADVPVDPSSGMPLKAPENAPPVRQNGEGGPDEHLESPHESLPRNPGPNLQPAVVLGPAALPGMASVAGRVSVQVVTSDALLPADANLPSEDSPRNYGLRPRGELYLFIVKASRYSETAALDNAP